MSSILLSSVLAANALLGPAHPANPKKTENANNGDSGSLAASAVENDYLKLKEEPEMEDGAVFLGMGVSLGAGRRVAGRVTFDRNRASGGGWVYAVQAASPQDGQAVKMSEAVLTSGGVLSFAAVLSRQQGVAALVLDGAEWDPAQGRQARQEPFLRLRRTVFGEASTVRGFRARLARKTEPFTIREGDFVVVDPEAGTLAAPGPELGKLYAEAFSALRAYDGLKDGQALAQWIDGQAAELSQAGAASQALRVELGKRLVSEMADRVAGASGARDLAKVRAAVDRMCGRGADLEMRAHEKKVFVQQVRRALSSFDESLAELPLASAAWAARLCRRAQGRWERIRLLAEEFKLAERRSARNRYQELDRACGKQRAAAKPEGLEAALQRVGSRTPRAKRLPAGFYRRFVTETGLEPRIEALASDPSRSVARRSGRIRELIRAAEIPDGLSRDLAASLPATGSWALLVPGLGTRVLEAEDVSPVKEYWASLWSPGRLAQRRREGRPVADDEAEVDLMDLGPCRRSAVALSRDPASGKRRMAVSAAYGEVEGILSGRADSDHYVLGPDGREVLPAVVGLKRVRLERDGRSKLVPAPVAEELSSKRVLAPEELSRLAAAARALEGHHGWGVEVSACFAADGLTVLGSSPIDRLLSAE
ncbi:MAG: hypothetical protein HY748_16885 [Elusimicrobia bacterium]|nr:hypothetical protein [Elusimicrobiota bacterium]